MKPLFSKSDLRLLSSILAVIMLSATIPLSVGIIIVSGPAHPEITADICHICHPIQTFDRVANTLLARPAATAPGFALRDQGAIAVAPVARLVEHCVVPDTPPPEPPV